MFSMSKAVDRNLPFSEGYLTYSINHRLSLSAQSSIKVVCFLLSQENQVCYLYQLSKCPCFQTYFYQILSSFPHFSDVLSEPFYAIFTFEPCSLLFISLLFHATLLFHVSLQHCYSIAISLLFHCYSIIFHCFFIAISLKILLLFLF